MILRHIDLAEKLIRQQALTRWGRAPFLNDFKPRSGDISVHKPALFIYTGEKNVAAPRLSLFFEIDRSQRSRVGLRRCRRSAASLIFQDDIIPSAHGPVAGLAFPRGQCVEGS